MEFLQPISRSLFESKYMINGETTPDQVFHDIAEEIARPEETEKRSEVQREFERIMTEGYFIPGGRILANARTYAHAKSKNYNNCFTVDIEDSMEGIYGSIYEDAMISRMGGGVGFDSSKLRPEGSKTTNGGEASGPISFLRVFDASAKTISSGGSRRSAHISLLNVDHPDIEKFIDAKQGDTDKALTQFNLSIKISDAFIRACDEDKDWHLQFEGTVYKTVKARALYDKMVKHAFEHNEPGIFFTDTVERDNNAWWAYTLSACNPCGEQPLPPYGLCCLGALNLTKFVLYPFTKKAKLDVESFKRTVYWSVRFLDNVLSATAFPLEKIEAYAQTWRRIGLGFTGLGDLFAMMGCTYGSSESKELSHTLGQLLRDFAYSASAQLAEEKGMAPGLLGPDAKIDSRYFEGAYVKKLPESIQQQIAKVGIRNIALLTVAPTGTSSLTVGNNCSSGIEPIFSLEYSRNIRTGNDNETIKEIVRDYAWLLYSDLDKTEDLVAPTVFSTTFDVQPRDAIDIQAIFQSYIDSSISKTLNFDGKSLKLDGYKDLFRYAYSVGLKGFTSFNATSGSMKGILETKTDDIKANPDSFIFRANAPRRPDELICDVHYIHANNQDFIVLAGLLNGSLYEIFVDEQNGHDLGSTKVGKIVKKGKGEYNLLSSDGKILVNGLSKNFTGSYGTLARLISMSLRHGVPLQFIIEQLQRSKEFLGFEKAVSRVLKHYIKEGEMYGSSNKCAKCGGTTVFQEGCFICKECGSGGCS